MNTPTKLCLWGMGLAATASAGVGTLAAAQSHWLVAMFCATATGLMVLPGIWVYNMARTAANRRKREMEDRRRQLSMELQKIRGTGSEMVMTDYPEEKREFHAQG